MIKRIDFKNFKSLRDTGLDLGRVTLLIGPNGTGKSSVLRGLIPETIQLNYARTISASQRDSNQTIDVSISMVVSGKAIRFTKKWSNGSASGFIEPNNAGDEWYQKLYKHRLFNFEANAIKQYVKLQPVIELADNGTGLAGVLDRLRDENPERFEQINVEVSKWLPAFDRILFETPTVGMRSISLRSRSSKLAISGQELSDGTLYALAVLTVAHLPEPPPVIGLEEPDRGLHPRLLQDVRDAIYRLAYPEQFGDKRQPVQVVITTHSPYMVDLFSEHPEDIVVCNLVDDNVKFTRLTELPNFDKIIDDASLGDLWYTGILGGVPNK